VQIPLKCTLHLDTFPSTAEKMNGQTNGSPGTTSPLRIYDAHSFTFPGPTPQAEDYDTFRGLDTAIVVDNGIILLLLEYSDYLQGRVNFALDGQRSRRRDLQLRISWRGTKSARPHGRTVLSGTMSSETRLLGSLQRVRMKDPSSAIGI